MEINEFIESLEKSNFSLAVEDGKLVLKGDKKKLSDDEINSIRKNDFVINYIKAHKEELIAYVSDTLKNISQKKSRDSSSIYRLSGLQQGMLFHGLYDSRAGAYTEQLSCDLVGPDLETIKKSWNIVLSRHSILRSSFDYDVFSVPVQRVYPDVELPVTLIDLREKNPDEQKAAVKEYEESDRVKRFDFKTPPLMRVGLLRLSEDRYRMFWTSHHILFDGWSMPILMEEFLNVYETLASGKEPEKVEEDRYEDYIRYIERGNKDHQEAYWRNYLKGIEHRTLLPFSGATTDRNKGMGEYGFLYSHIDADTTKKIQSYAQSKRITINTLVQGAWAFLLHKYTGSNSVVYGMIVSGRPDDLPNVEKRVGMYINTLPLHSTMKSEAKITDWLQDLQKDQVASREYQYTPLQYIQGLTGIQGDLFDSLLVFENYPMSKVISSKKWSLKIENVQMHEHNNYPFTISVTSADQINIMFMFNTELLDEVYIRKIQGHFVNVLLQMTDEKVKRLSDIRLLTEEEEDQILKEFNNTASDYPSDKTIADLFEEQALKSPDSTAVVFDRKKLTYKELNDRSNRLAHYLKKKGVKAETMVPICIDRSLDMMVGIIGILKAGGAYVPIDPEYPEERIKFMLEDTKASVILTSANNRSKLPESGSDVIEIDADWLLISNEPDSDPKRTTGPDSLANVIYTSGSTGKPKGAMVTQRNVVSLVKGIKYVALSKGDILLATGSPSFDATTFEYWSMLLNGGKLILCNESRLLNSKLLKEEIVDKGVNIMWFTSSWFNQLVDNDISVFKGLKTIIVGGEKLSEYHIGIVRETYPELEIVNGYGPTENTTFSLTCKVTADMTNASIPIGRPLENRSAYILDKDLMPVPVGVSGEIFLGGSGVSRGYLNQPDLTAEKFVKNPFGDGEVMYITGDLGRWMPDGNIEYLGRMDEQIKIRGYRIEPGEIESVLRECDLVNQAVVMVREDRENNRRLVGYVVPEGSLDRVLIIKYLESRLPDYMIPALWVELQILPLTSNGKIDRSALPDPDATEGLSKGYVAPGNELEWALSKNWQKILGVDRVGVHDDFFELGGDSLLAVGIFGYIEKLTGKKLAISTLFETPTIKQLAEIIKNEGWTPPWKSLVAVKPGGSKLPFFCVPAAAGTALSYQGLIKYILPDQPMYVLESIGLDGKDPPHSDLKEMAAFYVKEIRSLQPEGPYLIGGRCFGAGVAFEMAQQLTKVGQKVALLAILDTWPVFVEPPTYVQNPGGPVKRDLKHFAVRSFHNLKTGQLWRVMKNYSANEISKARKKIRDKIEHHRSDPKRRLYRQIWYIHLNAWVHYIASKYPGKVTLIEAENFKNEDRERWNDLAEGGLESYLIPGTDHKSIIKEPKIRLLAEKLNYVLEKAQMEIEGTSGKNGSVNKSVREEEIER